MGCSLLGRMTARGTPIGIIKIVRAIEIEMHKHHLREDLVRPIINHEAPTKFQRRTPVILYSCRYLVVYCFLF